MNIYQKNVIQEKTELDERIEKLCKFMDSIRFKTVLDDEDRRLVINQSLIMGNYSNILEQRIRKFAKKN